MAYRRTQQELHAILAHTKDTAPDPGGVPYFACAAVADVGAPLLLEVYDGIPHGAQVPSRWSASLTVFLPKGHVVIPDATATPLTLGDIACELVSKL